MGCQCLVGVDQQSRKTRQHLESEKELGRVRFDEQIRSGVDVDLVKLRTEIVVGRVLV